MGTLTEDGFYFVDLRNYGNGTLARVLIENHVAFPQYIIHDNRIFVHATGNTFIEHTAYVVNDKP